MESMNKQNPFEKKNKTKYQQQISKYACIRMS